MCQFNLSSREALSDAVTTSREGIRGISRLNSVEDYSVLGMFIRNFGDCLLPCCSLTEILYATIFGWDREAFAATKFSDASRA